MIDITPLLLATAPGTPSDTNPFGVDIQSLLTQAAQPIFDGAAVLIPVVVVLMGIHRVVEGKSENHTVLVAEMLGFIMVMEGALIALRKMAGI